jgi:pimeloyl-ACP methyl ester carboxylesterase
VPDAAARQAMRELAAGTAKMFAENDMAAAAAIYGDAPSRQTHKYKDPRGYAEFIRMLSEQSAQGHALTMTMLQARRPTLWDLAADLKTFSVPLLVIVGDEDETCLDGSVFLKRTAPTAGLLVIPRSGHTITSEEPDTVNAALAELFAAAEAGRWLAHRPPAA